MCGLPQYILLSDLEGAEIVSRKYSQNQVLRIPAGTQMEWRKSNVGLEIQVQVYPSFCLQVKVEPNISKQRL